MHDGRCDGGQITFRGPTAPRAGLAPVALFEHVLLFVSRLRAYRVGVIHTRSSRSNRRAYDISRLLSALQSAHQATEDHGNADTA